MEDGFTHFDHSDYPCFCSHVCNVVVVISPQNAATTVSSPHEHSHGHSHGDGHGHDDVNMHSVFLHVLGDALGSVAVIISGIMC